MSEILKPWNNTKATHMSDYDDDDDLPFAAHMRKCVASRDDIIKELMAEIRAWRKWAREQCQNSTASEHLEKADDDGLRAYVGTKCELFNSEVIAMLDAAISKVVKESND